MNSHTHLTSRICQSTTSHHKPLVSAGITGVTSQKHSSATHEAEGSVPKAFTDDSGMRVPSTIARHVLTLSRHGALVADTALGGSG